MGGGEVGRKVGRKVRSHRETSIRHKHNRKLFLIYDYGFSQLTIWKFNEYSGFFLDTLFVSYRSFQTY